MAGDADVPLDASAEPGVPHGQVGRLEDGVHVEQFAPGGLVIERPEPAAEFDEEGGPEDVVFENEGLERTDASAAGIAVLHAMRQRPGVTAVAEVFPLFLGNVVREFCRSGGLLAAAEIGKRVLRPQLDAGHLIRFDAQFAHEVSLPHGFHFVPLLPAGVRIWPASAPCHFTPPADDMTTFSS